MLTLLLYLFLTIGVAVVAAAFYAVQRVPRWSFKNTTCLVTGGSAGIGLEIAMALARHHTKHIVLAARREAVLIAAVQKVKAEALRVGSPSTISCVVMDVSQEASVASAIAAAKEQCGGSPVDLLVCSAGFAHPTRFIDSEMSQARGMMDVNYFGCLSVLWGVLPSMLSAHRGRIVLVSSMVARAPIAGYTLYAATKAALRAFAHSLDMENECFGVRVQVVSPPDVVTPGFALEEAVKSPECRAISVLGGATPFTAAEMGAAVVRGIADYRFEITLGTDGWLLSAGGAVMEPATNVPLLLMQTVSGGILRLVMSVYSKIHYSIVAGIRLKEDQPAAESKKQC